MIIGILGLIIAVIAIGWVLGNLISVVLISALAIVDQPEGVFYRNAKAVAIVFFSICLLALAFGNYEYSLNRLFL